MPSPLVTEVRDLIRTRTEDRRLPLTMPERALLLATLAPPRRDGYDAVTELEAAIAVGRRTILDAGNPLSDNQRAAVRRLLAAARTVLDYGTEAGPHVDPPAITLPPDPRPRRADVDA